MRQVSSALSKNISLRLRKQLYADPILSVIFFFSACFSLAYSLSVVLVAFRLVNFLFILSITISLSLLKLVMYFVFFFLCASSLSISFSLLGHNAVLRNIQYHNFRICVYCFLLLHVRKTSSRAASSSSICSSLPALLWPCSTFCCADQ